MSPELALFACRFLHDAAAMLLWGAFGYLAFLVPSRLAGDIVRQLAPIRGVAILVIAATALAALPLQAALVGEGWQDAANPTVLCELVTETSLGTAWLSQLWPSMLLLTAAALPRRLRPGGTAVLAGLVLATLASGGHARMNDGWEAIAHPLNDALHALAAGAWLGALVPLIPILSRLRMPAARADAAIALRRFSTAGHVAVALTVLTGIGNSLLIVGSPIGWSTAYRMLLTAKIAIVALMVAIAIFNRYALVPRIRRTGDRAVQAIAVGTIAELALGLGAILLVAAFGMMDPGG